MDGEEARAVLIEAQSRYINNYDVWAMLQRVVDRLDGEGVTGC